MQVAKLTQDYYGFVRQSVAPNTQAGTNQAEPKRPTPAALPAERVVEGEVLKNRGSRTGAVLDELLQRGRFGNDSANAQGASPGSPAARRAINTYLDNTAASRAGMDRQPRAVDYYA